MNKTLNYIELRRLTAAPEIRAEVEEREDGTKQSYITGYAVVFEQDSRVMYDYFVERIERNAFANCDMSDVVMVVDHSNNVGDVLARSRSGEGTLSINIDDKGVKFRFAVPDTTVGRDVLTLVERGDISECSFAFWVKKDEWEKDRQFGDKKYHYRRILEVSKLADLSIVVRGAYPQTSVGSEERAMAEGCIAALTPQPKRTGYSVELAEQIMQTI